MSYSNKKVTTKEKLPPMPKEARTEFIDLLTVQSVSENEHMMHYYITSWLDKRDLDWIYDDIGNIIVTKGVSENYPCVVAHMDTVHEIVEELNVWTTKTGDDHEIFFGMNGKKNAGIGGDDKCGIFSVFSVLEKFENIKCIFFTQEEGGCVGSGDIDLELFSDVGYIIQLDRWGREDFICKDRSGSLVSDAFNHTLKDVKKKYGYKDAEGLMTDSVTLFDRGVGVSCINVSCGYYEHHTDSEKIDLNQFWNSVCFLEEMILELGEQIFPHEQVVKTYKGSLNNYDYDDWGTGFKGTGFSGTGYTKPMKSINDMTDEEYTKWEEDRYGTKEVVDLSNLDAWHERYHHMTTDINGVNISEPADVELIRDILAGLGLHGFDTPEQFFLLSSHWQDEVYNQYHEYTDNLLFDTHDYKVKEDEVPYY